MTGLSLHAVDAATGRPAEGMRVRVLRAGGKRRVIAEGRLGADGTLDHPVVRTRLAAGLYEVVFVIGDFVGAAGEGFLEEAAIRFRLDDPDRHCHLPLKFTAFGVALFRGC
ncbi:hydroxyisourate hydrolase [Methylobacterium sp. NMS14P]|uniref:hydroxyisourate hydrolase n=1 Tax=unclassified Methylobacterium TaxID=2615210 RepID=UPI0009EBC40A|nr:MULTISPECIES: hydroxyisourate hydrolase [unclassified Methylobacterium]WCS26486.1 hydroxyisourate hydrolase [Methylobacterium sp. NMS14P]